MGSDRRIKNFVKLDGLDWEPVAQQFRDILKENRGILPAMAGDWHPIYPYGLYPNFFDDFPNVTEMFKPLGIEPIFAAFYGANAPMLGQIAHIDGLAGVAEVTGQWIYDRINIPIVNCHESITHFWKRNFDYDWETTRVKINHPQRDVFGAPKLPLGQPFANLEFLEEIDSFTLDLPTIMRTDVFHNVEILGFRYPRVALTLGFRGDISHLLDTNPEVQNLPDGITEAECGSYHLGTEGRIFAATEEEIQESLRDSFSHTPQWSLSLIDR